MGTSQGTDKGMTALLTDSADIVLIGPEASVYVQNSESPVKTKIFAGLTATREHLRLLILCMSGGAALVLLLLQLI